MSLYVDREDH